MDTRKVKDTRILQTQAGQYKTRQTKRHAPHPALLPTAQKTRSYVLVQGRFLEAPNSCMQQRGDRQMHHHHLPSCKRWSMLDCIQCAQNLNIQCRKHT
jgi:hypothetical protein